MNSTERYVAYEIISGKIKILLTSVKAGWISTDLVIILITT
jgi:hypothetical protein